MSLPAAAPLRLVSFTDLTGEVWGALIDAGRPVLVLGTPRGTLSAIGDEQLALEPDAGQWHVRGAGIELEVTPAGEARPVAPGTHDELCHVTGSVQLHGQRETVQLTGTRSLDPGFEAAGLDSLRWLSGWFGEDRAVALCAQRPAPGQHQGADRIQATLFDPGEPIVVTDPRLSTTFAADGHPTRAGLELWVASGEDLYPRRAAAEALAPGVEVSHDGLSVRVTPLRCHAGGHDGAGVYLLARF